MEAHLLGRYERAVAALIAHASIHAPHLHEESLRDNILRGERSICDRCVNLREALVDAAFHWRKSTKRRKTRDDVQPLVSPSIEQLGLTG